MGHPPLPQPEEAPAERTAREDVRAGGVPEQELRRAIVARLAAHGGFAGVSVELRHGRVQLHGSVATDDERRLAEQLAVEEAPGRELESHLRVAPG